MLERWFDSIVRTGGRSRPRWSTYGVTALAVAGLALLFYPVRDVFDRAILDLLYLLLLFVIGLVFGAGPAVAGAVLAFLLADVLFYEPYFTFAIDRTSHVIGLLSFLAIGISSGLLASRLRHHAAEARREADRTAMLYDLNRALTSGVTLDQVLTSVVRGVVEIYGATACRLLVRDDGGERFETAAAWPVGEIREADREMLYLAQRAAETDTIVGIGAAGRRVVPPHGIGRPSAALRRPGPDLVYVPVGTSDTRFGVLEVIGRPGGGRFGPNDMRVLASFADQAALAVQRTRLIDRVTRARAIEASNELKSALLAAVSHDLRTPLAAIKMSASALRDPAITWKAEARDELLSAIEDSTDWLAQVVDNLLDLSRIEGGALRPDRDWHDITDLLQHVLEQMERQTARHLIDLRLPDDLPLVWLDYVQISQVMTNLIGNAVKFAPPGSTIEVAATPVEAVDMVELRVADHGPGIPAEAVPHIFETFYRVQPGGHVPGTGVGLAICKGLVEAHGGTIATESRVGEGTTMRVRLPVGPVEPARDGRDEA